VFCGLLCTLVSVGIHTGLMLLPTPPPQEIDDREVEPIEDQSESAMSIVALPKAPPPPEPPLSETPAEVPPVLPAETLSNPPTQLFLPEEPPPSLPELPPESTAEPTLPTAPTSPTEPGESDPNSNEDNTAFNEDDTDTDFPLLPESTACEDRSACWQSPTNSWRSAARTLEEQLQTEGYELNRLIEETGITVYEVTQGDQLEYYLTLVSTLEGILYTQTEQQMTPDELVAIQQF
jgi:hypothetical protein